MTQPDSSSAPDESIDVPPQSAQEHLEAPMEAPRDQDRLYTDEFIRDNENASRQLLISFITLFVVGAGALIWFLVTQNGPQTVEEPVDPPPPPTDLQPLPPDVPEGESPPESGFPLPAPPTTPTPEIPLDQLPDADQDVPAFPLPDDFQPDVEADPSQLEPEPSEAP